MDLKNQPLDNWLKKPPVKAFSNGKKKNYHAYYLSLKDYLEENIHNQVVLGATLQDPDILINDHGAQHIETVIERATDLVKCATNDFSALEVYILIQCIQLHDVGNISGRYKHEVNMDEIILEAENLSGRDAIERILIRDIAQAHGGTVLETDDKDKIGLLKEIDPQLDGQVRVRAIASILRFADELSDDKRRAYYKLLIDGEIPKKSEVFHAYAHCLDTVLINKEDKSIELAFKIPKDFATRKFGKMGEEILLLDEIYNRIMKMHLERIYCMRFLKGIIDIEKISVSIEYYDKFLMTLPHLKFEISESGYPLGNAEGIFGLCDSLVDDAGNKIDGNYILSAIARLPETEKDSKSSKLKRFINFFK